MNSPAPAENGTAKKPLTNAEKQAAFRARQLQKQKDAEAVIEDLRSQLKAANAIMLNQQHRINGLSTLLADFTEREAKAKAGAAKK